MANVALILSQKVIRGLRAFHSPSLSNPTTRDARILIRMNPRTRGTRYLQSGASHLVAIVDS